jgi:aminoglycoside phosphotransferase family enzyme/predicted kinase
MTTDQQHPPDEVALDLQDAVFNLLGDPATYGVAEVKRLDTHAAVVFLAADRALKVKRAVRFPFLDYSTLDRRKAACLAELEVNRRFAPQLYRRVVPITRDRNGTLAIDGAGVPVEWAVEMVRFDETMTLDHLADRGELDDKMLGELAIAVAAMHERAERADAAAWLAAVQRFIDQNTAAFREHAELFPRQSVAELDRNARETLARLRPLLGARGDLGLIRRGHGDLHLRNIAVLDGAPVAFDALEFDPITAAGDVLYDLAFLLMDLVERGLDRAANRVLNGYFAAARRSEDYDGIAALPFFMSLRAAIRANVTAARLAVVKPADRAEIAPSARRYFELASSLLASVRSVVICTGGLSGSGKSVLARALAPLLPPSPGALVLRSDVERKMMFGVAEHDRLPAEAYRAEVSAQVYRTLQKKAARIARSGHSVVVDAVFAAPDERRAMETAIGETGAAFAGLFLTADLKTRLERVGARGPDASDANDKVVRLQEDFPLGAMGWSVIDASGPPESTLAKARVALALESNKTR